ncbi:MAG: nitroreductase [Muribaculaceae bacterium]|nr:nitroreductase [Muribaculaceae bacterium]
MTLLEAIKQRHSVRSYTPQPIDNDKVAALNALIEKLNEESGLHMQLVTDEPRAFGSFFTHYGAFSGVANYFALVGKRNDDKLSERVGYYGEKLVLEAQRMGLNTCWVALTYSKSRSRVVVNEDEKLVCVISLGYGTTQGHGHRIKTINQVAKAAGEMPKWFVKGVEAALLAPTAINQQQFRFTLIDDSHVKAEAKIGFYSKVDLGIVKLHFELGAAPHEFSWS